MSSQLLLYQPYFKVDKAMEPREDEKNDFQNALKRNLHSWAQWRTDVNDCLVESLFTGQPMDDVGPLDEYLQHHNRRLPTENPKTLLCYSASKDTNTNLRRDHFLSFGIPRVKKANGSSTNSHRASTASHRASTRNLADDVIDEEPTNCIFIADDQRTTSQQTTSQARVSTAHSPQPSFADKRLPRMSMQSPTRLPRRDIHVR